MVCTSMWSSRYLELMVIFDRNSLVRLHLKCCFAAKATLQSALHNELLNVTCLRVLSRAPHNLLHFRLLREDFLYVE